MTKDNEIYKQLQLVYEEIMWLAQRPNVTPSVARSWYTHATAERLKKYIRTFTGMVSQKSIDNPHDDLRLEHYMRIQTTLTHLVKTHKENGIYDSEVFIQTILDCEKVHIVTKKENYDAMKAKGDYIKAGIKLVAWKDIPNDIRQILRDKMLNGKVANPGDFSK